MPGFAAYPTKRLCDVVFPGTHDAGIYGNNLGATARTQNLSLGEQAAAGVRYFDLRIATIKSEMLDQARAFAMQDPGEFLILRFSKCADMEGLANQCLLKLGAEHFAQNVNLNVALINSLQGRVITVFDQEDFKKFSATLKATPGILPVKALFNSDEPHATYSP